MVTQVLIYGAEMQTQPCEDHCSLLPPLRQAGVIKPLRFTNTEAESVRGHLSGCFPLT